MRTRLATLFKVSTVDVEHASSIKAIKSIRNVKKVTFAQSTSPLVKEAASLLLDYPLALFMEQFRRSSEYRGTHIDAHVVRGNRPQGEGVVVQSRVQSSLVLVWLLWCNGAAVSFPLPCARSVSRQDPVRCLSLPLDFRSGTR